MAVINILKDGTVVDDMSTVTIPKEKVERIMKIILENKRRKPYTNEEDLE